MMRFSRPVPIVVVFLIIGCTRSEPSQPDRSKDPEPARAALKSVEEFSAIADTRGRSQAMFVEVARVLRHPRCANCHESGERPRQGESGALHQPLVARAGGGAGAPGMLCMTCHGSESFENVPGAAGWLMAPERLGWFGNSDAQLCASLKENREELGKVTEYLKTSQRVA
ncbi:MAG: hypothetical protein AAFY60_06235, partial [Myxococcota bacterium]